MSRPELQAPPEIVGVVVAMPMYLSKLVLRHSTMGTSRQRNIRISA